MKIRTAIASATLLLAALVPGHVSAAKASLAVPADAHYGDVVTATYSGPNSADWVYIQCYNPDYVFAAFYAIEDDGSSLIGPLAAYYEVWPEGPADCTAQAGYFTQRGFGDWKVVASTAFHVSA